MQKYLLTAIYLLIMLAILKYPITLPNEGKAIPTWGEEQPIQAQKDYVMGKKTQKTAFQPKNVIAKYPITLSENGTKKTY